MLTFLSTCSRHVCFVNFGVWVGWGGCCPCQLAHVMYASWTLGFGLGGMLMSLSTCMLRELRGLGGGGMLTSLSTCSRHVCFVNFGVGWVIYIYICIHIKVHSHLDTNIDMYINICINTFTFISQLYIYIYICTYILLHIYIYLTYVYIYIFITYIYICTYVFTHIYICICMFRHAESTCRGMLGSSPFF